MTVNKITINPIVNYGDNVTFTITVKNTGHYELDDVFVHEKSFEGLTYLNYTSNKGNWTYENGIFRLNGTLKEGSEASFNVTFKALAYDNLTNIIVAGSNETHNITANNTTFVRNPSLTVEKISLNLTSNINDIVKFMIIVKNTGNVDLTNIFVKEIPDAGLIYANEFTPIRGTWFIENDTAKLDGILAPGENASFNISFRTSAYGNLTNSIKAGSNQTDNQTVNNTTFVKNPKLTIEKITISKSVYLGENVTFTIIVRNTGNINLKDIVVDESSYTGLTYVNYTSLRGNWIYEDGLFKLNQTLNAGDNASFNIVFNSVAAGNLTNVIIVRSNETGNQTTNNTTFVKNPKLEIEKITISKSVYLGENVIFNIIVRNTGNIDLSGIIVNESSYTGLNYVGYVPVQGDWIYEDDLFKLNQTLGAGENASFYVIFNSVNAGNLTNIIVVRSNETGNQTTNNTTFVKDPNLTIEKITENKTVYIGDNVTFTIIVRNTGNVDLSGIVINENSPAGLIYIDYTSISGNWIYEDGVFKLNQTLNAGDNASFKIVFTAVSEGNLTNIVIVKSNETGNQSTNNTTFVKNPGLAIEKITINKSVYIGDNVTFTIVVKNTGNVDLSDIIVNETAGSGLTYVGYSSIKCNWIYENEVFKLNETLSVGDNASFNVIFTVVSEGNLTNTVIVKSNETGNQSANNTTFVKNPGLAIEKITVNKTAYIGDNVTFTIIVRNTGNVDLSDIIVNETAGSGLTYVGYSSIKCNWIYEDGVFKLNETLNAGDNASFNVIFTAVSEGNLTNTIVVRSNETGNQSTNNTTFVKDPKLTIEKITENKTVYIGDNVTFTIIVRNTGNVDLSGIIVNETAGSGLTYVDYNSVSGNWIYEDGVFKLNETLSVGDNASFNVIFTAVSEGNLTNTVIVRSNETGNQSTNNSTFVKDPKLTIEKITENKTVYIGDNVTFTIVVRNTGNVDLSGIIVNETAGSGLTYIDYTSISGNWIYEDGVFKLNQTLNAGDTVSFNVIFTAVAEGNLTNTVIVKSNETGNQSANNTTFVKNPGLAIEKITINKSVYIGDTVTFTIVVRNTGNVDLSDIIVNETVGSGLTYVDYTSISGNWIYENRLFKLNETLNAGDTASFNVIFAAVSEGNLTNTVVVRSNETGNQSANNTTFVKNPKLTIEKITVNETVYIGDNVTFTIVVRNTGNVDLSDIIVKEAAGNGLDYLDYTSVNGNWIYENGLFKLNETLNSGSDASFNVIFTAVSAGNLTNTIVVTSNETGNQTTNNTTFVKKSELSIVKLTVNKTVYLGENVIFTIIVRNTGDTDLTDVYVREVKHDYLTFVGYENGNRNWTCNNETFVLSGDLLIGEYASFNVIYRTEKTGLLENIVHSASNQTEIISTNNTTLVKDNSEIPHPDIVISKQTITKSAVVGDKVIFRVIIKNTGNVDLDNVSFLEKYPDALKLIGFKGDGWTVKNNIFRYHKTLKVNETIAIDIIFEALKAGNFTNEVIAYIGDVPVSNDTSVVHISNKTNNLPPKNNTNKHDKNSSVVSKSQKVEKISLKPTGNPILLLLVIFSIMGIYPVKKRK